MQIKRKKGGQIKHNMCYSRPYKIWSCMIQRCSNKKLKEYKWYGAKGIKVCKRWKNFINFWNDMKEGYDNYLTLDRIDVKKGYNKNNCRWITQSQQLRNRTNNIIYKGEYAVDASVRISGNKYLVSQRLFRGWNIKDAFTLPLLYGLNQFNNHEKRKQQRGGKTS